MSSHILRSVKQEMIGWHCQPIISCFSKIQNGSAFLLPVYPGCPRKETVK